MIILICEWLSLSILFFLEGGGKIGISNESGIMNGSGISNGSHLFWSIRILENIGLTEKRPVFLQQFFWAAYDSVLAFRQF